MDHPWRKWALSAKLFSLAAEPLSVDPPRALSERSVHADFHTPNALIIPCDLVPARVPKWYKDQETFLRWRDDWTVDVPSQGPNLMRPVTPGNEVTYLIDGPDTFRAMVEAMRTAGQANALNLIDSDHFIYLIGWWLSIDFELIPGDPTSTIAALWSAAEAKGAQIRALLFYNRLSAGTGNLTNDPDKLKNVREAAWINNELTRDERKKLWPKVADRELRRGAAILDRRLLQMGAHHQKILLVHGREGLIAFCGGLDINPDRMAPNTIDPRGVEKSANVEGDQDGAPFHDVHCRIRGPAAYELLRVFIQRWDDHLESPGRNRKGQLRGLSLRPSRARKGNHFVQIGCTFGNGSAHWGIGQDWDPDLGGFRTVGTTSYRFAPNGERTIQQMIEHAIGVAQRFIYMEDQYLVNMDASKLLCAALDRLEHLTIVIPASRITAQGGQSADRRKQFLEPLLAKGKQPGGRNKVRPFILNPPGDFHTYVHTKMYIFDDEFAIIGSANCGRRSWTHDGEVAAGICDELHADNWGFCFAHRLRMALWAEHLNLDPAELVDGVASAVHWIHLPPDARVAPYDPATEMNDPPPVYDWDRMVDPDGH